MRRRAGTICILAGAALILAALSLFLWNRNEDRQAGKFAGAVLVKVEEAAEDDSAYPDPFDKEMTVTMIDGYSYIGYLSVPTLGLELPVMADWSYPQLKLAPCRYYGSTKTDDLVIAAHNYAYHFGQLKNMNAGDAVFFTDMDGVVSSYEVAEVDILNPTAVEEMTDSGYALTLFTCTYGGKSRVTVRCDRTE